jgi:LCP family protein required for cell wall assembly
MSSEQINNEARENARNQLTNGINKNKKPVKKKKSKWVVALRVILIVAIVVVGAGAFVLSRSKPEEDVEPDFNVSLEPESSVEGTSEYPTLNVSNDPIDDLDSLNVNVFKDSDYTHYLLIGIDSRQANYTGRGDALMIFSINSKTNRLVLTSIPRDSYVYIEGKGYDKITHAYAYGKAKLMADTIERNFDIDIEHYFTINFKGVEAVVDALGGIDLELTEAESEHMESFFKVSGTHEGMNTLTGKQALTYCRIRYIDTDFARTNRQYKVLSKIYEKVKAMSASQYPKLISSMYPYFYTDCTVADCINIGSTIMNMGLDSIENYLLFGEGESDGRRIDGTYYQVIFDLQASMEKWREFMGVTDYEASDTMKGISDDIKEKLKS